MGDGLNGTKEDYYDSRHAHRERHRITTSEEFAGGNLARGRVMVRLNGGTRFKRDNWKKDASFIHQSNHGCAISDRMKGRMAKTSGVRARIQSFRARDRLARVSRAGDQQPESCLADASHIYLSVAGVRGRRRGDSGEGNAYRRRQSVYTSSCSFFKALRFRAAA